MALCPECDADIDVSEFDVDEGDVVSCSECGANLMVVSLSPLELDVASDDDDDDDDESDDEDEFDEVDEDDGFSDEDEDEGGEDDDWDH